MTRPSSEAEEGATLERVLSTAAELFRTHGYAATTTREIASRLGIQKASLYYHISSKEDLLYQLVVSTLRRSRGAVDAASEEPASAVERLRRVVRAHLTEMHRDPDKNGTALMEMRSLVGERYAEVIRLRDEYEAIFRRLIEDGQRERELRRDVDARYLTLALLSMLNWTLVWYHGDGPLSVEELADMMFSIFLQGAQGAHQPGSATQTRAKGTAGSRTKR